VRADRDSIWKEILNEYFQEFLAFFFPVIHADIDWGKPYEFLDKELEKVVRDSEVGRRLVDKLVKVYLIDGVETWLLIHVEVQGYVDLNFEKRMYSYNYRIFDRYDHEVISLAVLTDDDEKFRPNTYRVVRCGFEYSFRFPTVKLLDYNKNWEQLEANPSPFAIVVMAHLKVQQLKKPNEKLAWKLKLFRMLYERGYERKDVVKLFRFIDWFILLPGPKEIEFWQEVDKYEEAKRMPYVTSVERIGRWEGTLSVILRQLTRRFGELEPKLEQRIRALGIKKLEKLSEELLDFSNLEEVNTWLEKQKPVKGSKQ
jgi:hypothetical protein